MNVVPPRFSIILAAAAGFAASGLRPPTPPQEQRTHAVTAFVGVTVLPMDRPGAQPGQTVIVRDGRIDWIRPSAQASIPEDAVRIQGYGRFLVPGLADMHVHCTADDFPLFVANGVTTIREMNGSPEHLEWKRRTAEGELLGPSMFVSSTLLTGASLQWRHVLIKNRAEALEAARSAVALGYDYLKVYDGLSRESYSAIAEVGRQSGVLLVGHIPADVGLDGVLKAGQYGIEHLEQLIRALGGPAADTTQFDAAARRIADTGTWVTPTLAVMEVLSRTRTPEIQRLFDAPEMKYVDPDTWSWWSTLKVEDPGEPPQSEHALMFAQFFGKLQALLRALVSNGVRIVAGTDTPNPLMVPGFSLHREIEALHAAGLSPYASLRAATVDAADLVGMPGTFGVIRAGARADLLLVGGDPLEDLSLLRTPEGVMVRGRWLPRTDLDSMLQKVAARYGR